MKNTHKADATKVVRLQTMSNEDLQKELREAYEKLNLYRSNDLSNYIFGKTTPKAIDIEEAILGACLVDKEAFPIVSDLLNVEDFYAENHKLIFRAMGEIKSSGSAIDLLTVATHINDKYKRELKEFPNGKLEVYTLVELTSRVASSANVEYHARIVKQKAYAREAIRIGSLAIREAYEEQKDIFDLYDELNNLTRANNPKRILRVMSMNDAIIEGAKMPKRKELVGNLIRENELTILYGDEGTGKSILAFQIAIAMSKGSNLFDLEEFKNECGVLKTLVFDFELETAELFSRYSINSECYDFGNNLFRSDLNPECLDLENGSEKLMKAVQQAIEAHQPQFVVVDNITWLVDEAQDANIATTFMKKILTMQRKTGFSCIIVAHTPKRNTSEEIESRHLAGSKNLSNFAKNLIAVSHSKLDPSVRYIKQVKCRNAQKLYGYDNVIQCAIHKEENSPLLEWKFRKTTPEVLHLSTPEQLLSDNEICIEALKLKAKKLSWDDIVDEMNLSMDRTTLYRKVQKYQAKNVDWEKLLETV